MLTCHVPEDVESARKTNIPQKTEHDMKYCLWMWSKWCLYRNSVARELSEAVPNNFTESIINHYTSDQQ